MAKQFEFKRIKGWGGKRRGAGRPNRSNEVGHGKRANVALERPIHITMRLKIKASLRTKRVHQKFQEAATAAREFGLFINHYSILGNHLHLIAEAKDNESIGRGMRSFGGRLGKGIRSFVGGRGPVFAGRYHAHQLKSPTEYKRALKYVLLNHSQHEKLIAAPDNFSSARFFTKWSKLVGNLRDTMLGTLDGLTEGKVSYLTPPRSWVGRGGWVRGIS